MDDFICEIQSDELFYFEDSWPEDDYDRYSDFNLKEEMAEFG